MILLSPGPVPVIPEIRQAQTKEMITHRSPEFGELYADLVERLKKYLDAYEAYVVTGSGALGVETLILNLAQKKDKMLCLSNGEFGSRFAQTAKLYCRVQEETQGAGKGWNLERAKPFLDKNNAQLLGIVYNETGYGVRNHIKEICQYAKEKGMRVIVDAISAWPAHPFGMGTFNVDGFITASQKAIGAPPGMALLGLSKQASEFIEQRNTIPSMYGDLRRHREHYQKNHQTPNTPAISLFYALQRAFDILDEKGGLEACVDRHAQASQYVRARLLNLGFSLIAEQGFESNTVSAFSTSRSKEIRDRLQEDYKIKIVGCKGEYAANGLRIAHMGHFSIQDLDACLNALQKIKGSA